MAQAILLLQTALALLGMLGDQGNLPQEIHTKAYAIAQQAITLAETEIGKIKAGVPSLSIQVAPSTNSPSALVGESTTTPTSTPTSTPQVTDRTLPAIWEAQFGEQITREIGGADYSGQRAIRIVTSEPVDILKAKFRLVDYPEVGDRTERPLTYTIISENVPRDASVTCYVKCSEGGFYSIFIVNDPLEVRHKPEFVVPDMSGNFTYPWHSGGLAY